MTLDVIAKLPDDQFLMNLGGMKITARSDAPLTEGAKLQVRILSVQPQLQLQVLESTSRTTELQPSEQPVQKGSPANAGIQVSTKAPQADAVQKPGGQPDLQLASGQILTVRVQEKLPGNRYQLAIRDFTITATSDIPLREGEKLQVKVRSLQPQIILNVMDAQKQMTDARINEKLVQWRVYPDSMAQLIAGLAEFSENLKSVALPSGFSKQDADILTGLLKNIVFSKDTLKNPLFVKDFVAQTGMMLENHLALRAEQKMPEGVFVSSDALKTSLTQLSEAIGRALKETVKPDSAATAGLQDLASLTDDILKNLPSGFSKKDADALVKLLNHLASFPKTKTIPPPVRDLVAQTGVIAEKDLAALAGRKPGAGVFVPADDNIKASLLKLSEALSRTLQNAVKPDAPTTAALQNISLFTAEALKTVETGQVVNVVYQQNENGLYLQIPLALGDTYRQADIFIRPDDKNAPPSEKYSSCSVNIFLNLDYLGEMAIDVGIHQGRIRCIIKCENSETRELLDASSRKLQEALTAIGYGVGHIECVKTSDLAGKKAEFIASQIPEATDLVNSFA